MTSETIVALAALVVGLVSTVTVTVLGFVERRQQRREKLSERVRLTREPLNYAAGDLQSRVRKLLLGQYADVSRLDGRSERYVVVNTAFVFAQYLGWAELARQRVMLAGGTRRSEALRRPLDSVQRAFAVAELGPEFRLHANEQRAIGELMLCPDPSGSGLTVMGYAAFDSRFETDSAFQDWLEPITRGLAATLADGPTPPRLYALRTALLEVIEVIDPQYHYTPRDWRDRSETAP